MHREAEADRPKQGGYGVRVDPFFALLGHVEREAALLDQAEDDDAQKRGRDGKVAVDAREGQVAERAKVREHEHHWQHN